MPRKRKSIFVLSFSTIRADSRVLRQVQYLAPHFDVTVMGYGGPHPAWEGDARIAWREALPIAAATGRSGRLDKLTNRALLAAGKLHPKAYERLYWGERAYGDALRKAVESGCDAVHANDWNALPVAAEAARQTGARLVFDAHEYAPLEFEESRAWRFLISPMIRHVLRTYAPRADQTITVAPAIAERYAREFGFNPEVVMNAPVAPPPADAGQRERDFSRVRLVYQGCAQNGRRIEDLIRTLALCDARYSLHLMLTGNAPDYLSELRRLGDDLAPGRVEFRPPVPPEQVVREISAFDMGFCFVPPSNYSWLVSLPNKFFECIVAGLPVCVGPSPSMAEIVNAYGLGCVSPSFEPNDFAATLNALSTAQLAGMERRAREAAGRLNADVEMGKLVGIYQGLLGGGGK